MKAGVQNDQQQEKICSEQTPGSAHETERKKQKSNGRKDAARAGKIGDLYCCGRMKPGQEESPERIGESLDSLSRIKNEPVSLRKIPRVPK